MVSHRSTKGASKARRDHINCEIRNMRALLPISQEDQERLSYLHSMAAICTYIRKSVLFQGLRSADPSHCSLPYEAFLQALHGFILVTTPSGKLVYVSENVAEYLGFSMVDVLQGDTVYDMVERVDVDVVKANLDIEKSSSPERSFTCQMQTTKAFKLQHGSGSCSMLVRGSYRMFPDPCPSLLVRSSGVQPLFVSLCTPTVDRLYGAHSHCCDMFSSVHRPDMTFTQVSHRPVPSFAHNSKAFVPRAINVIYFLGYSAEEMSGRSWYSLVHPEDLSLSADSHTSLVQADEDFQVQMVLRLQCKNLSWMWIYTRANRDSEFQGISCTNFIISETEARFLQQKISSNAFKPPSLANGCQPATHPVTPTLNYKNTKTLKRRRMSNSQSEEPSARKRRESERDVFYVACGSSQSDVSPVPFGDSPAFTPPYTPASSSSPVQKGELSHDLLMDQLLSSPEGSYYSYPEPGLTCYHSPSDSIPEAPEHTFDQGPFALLTADSPASSPTCDFQTSDARLVPDCLSDTCESPVECALHQDDFSLLEEPQGGALVHVHHVPEYGAHPHLLTPNQSPTSQEYNEREQAEISILAQQISSLASSFDMSHTLRPLQPAAANPQIPPPCTWSHPFPPPSAFKRELVLDDSMFDSILNDLESVTRKSSHVRFHPGSYAPGLGSCDLDQDSPRPSPTITDDSADQFTTSMNENTGLHQLNQYMQSSFQQDGLAEENLY